MRNRGSREALREKCENQWLLVEGFGERCAGVGIACADQVDLDVRGGDFDEGDEVGDEATPRRASTHSRSPKQ